VFALLTTYCLANNEQSDSKFQVSLRQSTYYGNVHISDNPNRGSTDFVSYTINATGATAHYVFTPYTSIGTSLYSLHICSTSSNEHGVSCSIDEPIFGTSIDLLIGHNMASDGVFIYTGVRYYWEFNEDNFLGAPIIPIGIGFRFKDISAEVSTEFRDEYSDFHSFNIFDEPDSGTVYYNEASGIAMAMPIHISIGYLF